MMSKAKILIFDIKYFLCYSYFFGEGEGNGEDERRSQINKKANSFPFCEKN